MSAKVIRYEIPASVREANEIIFSHEDNEYKINKNGMRINIPSDAQIYSYVGTEITHISLPFMDITLWDSKDCMPHITIYPESLRDWVKEVY